MKNDFSERLIICRKRAGFNQDELAELSDVSVDTVRRWEGGKQEPRLGELRRVAYVLKVPVSQLIGEENTSSEADESSNAPIFVNPIVRNGNKRKKTIDGTIVIQQGNIRLEIPATSRGYDILEKKLKEVNVNADEISVKDMAMTK